MLTRIRIEVEGEDSAAATEEALSKYEHVIQVAEAQRYGIGYCIEMGSASAPAFAADGWKQSVALRDFYNEELGREVTDEVIEYDPSLPGYKGRRVVRFERLDTRWLEHTEVGSCGVEVESSDAARDVVDRISFAAPDKAAA